MVDFTQKWCKGTVENVAKRQKIHVIKRGGGISLEMLFFWNQHKLLHLIVNYVFFLFLSERGIYIFINILCMLRMYHISTVCLRGIKQKIPWYGVVPLLFEFWIMHQAFAFLDCHFSSFLSLKFFLCSADSLCFLHVIFVGYRLI